MKVATRGTQRLDSTGRHNQGSSIIVYAKEIEFILADGKSLKCCYRNGVWW